MSDLGGYKASVPRERGIRTGQAKRDARRYAPLHTSIPPVNTPTVPCDGRGISNASNPSGRARFRRAADADADVDVDEDYAQ